MKLNKFYVVIFSIIINFTLQNYSLPIFSPGGYKDTLDKFNEAMKKAMIHRDEKDQSLFKNYLKISVSAIETLETHANDLQNNIPLRAYLANTPMHEATKIGITEGFLPKIKVGDQNISSIFIDDSKQISELIELYKTMLATIKRELTILINGVPDDPTPPTPSKKPSGAGVPTGSSGPTPKSEPIEIKISEEDKTKFTKELKEMIQPISEYIGLLHPIKAGIIEKIQEIIKYISKADAKNTIMQQKITAIKTLYSDLNKIDYRKIGRPEANAQANQAVSKFNIVYSKIND